MTKKKRTKSALLTSALSLFLCSSMFVGITFAWFTDSVTSANNIITAGNLDVELKYAKVDGDKLTDWDTVGGKDNIFDKNARWEPGRVEVVYLEVANLGSLSLKYQLGVNVNKETPGTNVAGEEFKLSNYLVFKVVNLNEMPTVPYTRSQAINAAGAEMGLKSFNGVTTPLEVKDTDYVALIVYMPESVGDEANFRGDAVPTIELGINLYATQLANESDSFGDDYDDGANHPEFKVTTANDLQNALNEATAGDVIELKNDIVLTEPIVIPAAQATFSMRSTPAPVEIDLNGKAITGVGRNAEGRVHTLINKGNAVIMNGTITSTGTNGGSAILNTGVLTLENVTANGAPSDTATGTASYAVNTEGSGAKLTVNNSNISGRGAIGATKGAKVEINGGTFHTPTVAWGHAVYASNEGTEVVINDGTFSEGYEMAADNWGMYQIYSGQKAKVIVNGGNFLEWDCANGYDLCTASEGVIEIYGGTFADNPSKYLADVVNAVEVDGVYYVVPENVDSVVCTADELAKAIVAGGEVFVAADIDMNNAWASVVPANGLTILGNGHTITNLNLPLLAGKAGPNVTVKGLTISDSKVGIAANESGLGSGAFMTWADWGGTVVFEDCHLLNSTVTGNERAAAFIGYSIADVTIKNCSVEGGIIEAVGSTAGLIGHANGVTTIENSKVANTMVAATEDRTGKTALAGALVGTVNAATALINVTSSNNTVSNNGATPVSAEIGRIVSGSLTIDGAPYVTTSEQLIAAIQAGATEVYLAPGDYALRFTNNVSFNADNLKIVGVEGTNLSISSSEVWYGRVQGSNVTFENIHFTSSVGTTGKATYNNCTFDGWAICASSNKEVTTFNDCTINGCLNTSIDFNSGDVFVNNCEIAKAEYSGSMTVNFEGCQIGEVIIWNSNTNFTNCKVATMNLDGVTTARITVNGEPVNA